MSDAKKPGPKPTADSLSKNLNAKVTAGDLRIAAAVRKRLKLPGNSALVRALLREAAERHGIS